MAESREGVPPTEEFDTGAAAPGDQSAIRTTLASGESAGGAESTPAAAAGRFVQLEEIARGGMGIVYRATDTAFGRDVAVKVLSARLGGSSTIAERFVGEARITGQLQHPGIPAVHDLGTLADGRPFLAMKLVKGRTLEDLLRERASPGADLGRFISVFEQICQAMAYVHDHHVVHRDLKPANIMVGSFGEVQVMDWGLAKVLDPANRTADQAHTGETIAPATQIQTPEGDSAKTQAGSVLGTPGYMPPEQAIGAIDQIDQRSDVFGLGAILCAILTGQPPFVGADAESTRQLSARGKLESAFARLDECQAEAELVEICKRCLSPEKEKRPENAGEIAKAVAEFRSAADERARRAELDRAAAEAEAREQRKRRRVQLALAGSVIVFLIALGAIGWRIRADRLKRESDTAHERLSAEEQVRAADDEARRNAAQRDWRAAVAASRRAVDLAQAAHVGEQLRGEVETRLAQYVAEADAAERDRRLSNALADCWSVEERISSDTEQPQNLPAAATFDSDERYREAFRDYGFDVDRQSEAAAQYFARRPEELRLDVVAGLDAWAYARRERGDRVGAAHLLTLADRIDPDPQRKRLRKLVSGGQLRRERVRREVVEAFLPARQLTPPPPSEDLARLRRLAAERATAHSSAYTVGAVSMALFEAGEFDRALELVRTARQLHPRDAQLAYLEAAIYVKRDPPSWLEALAPLQAARALRPDSGMMLLMVLVNLKRSNEAIALAEDLNRRQPNNPMVLRLQAFVLMFNGRPQKAEELLREAVKLQPNQAHPRHHRGLAFLLQGRWAEAADEFRAAAKLNPNDPEIQKHLGHALIKLDRPSEAEAAYRESLRLRPGDANVRLNLGSLLFDRKEWAEAEAEFRRAIALRPDHALYHGNLARALDHQNRLAEAEEEYRRAIEIVAKDVDFHRYLAKLLDRQKRWADSEKVLGQAEAIAPGDADVQREWGRHWLARQRLHEAEAAFGRALSLRPDDTGIILDLGIAIFQQRRWRDAERLFRMALTVEPELQPAHFNLGNCLYQQKRFAEAEREFRTAVQITPDDPDARRNLGHALGAQRKWPEAEKAYRDAMRLGGEDYRGYQNLVESLVEQGRQSHAVAELNAFAGRNPTNGFRQYIAGSLLLPLRRYADAEKALREAIRLKYEPAEAYCNMGHALQRQGRFAEAIPYFRRGDELGRKRANWSYPSAKWLRDTERLTRLEQRLPAILRGEEKLVADDLPDLIEYCTRKKQVADGAYLAGKLVAENPNGTRISGPVYYDIACVAAQAAAGNDPSLAKFGVEEWGYLSDLAYRCLRHALDARNKLAADAGKRNEVRDALLHWKKDADLTSVRDPAWLAAMPKMDRGRWEGLWREVDKVIADMNR